jgi:gluconokinase
MNRSVYRLSSGMSESYLLAVDIGTSATKAVVFDVQLRTLAIIRKSYLVHASPCGRSEQEPETIYQGVLTALREVMQVIEEPEHLRAVVLSSQMNSLLAIDPLGKAITPSLTWADTRSINSSHTIQTDLRAVELTQRTGCPITPIYPLSKIHWMKSNLDLPADIKFISIKEYVIFQLTGQFVVDWMIASATGMMDVASREWDTSALTLLNISRGQLSEIVSPRHVITEWRPEVISQIGLPEGTPLIVGGGDGPLASLGVGGIQPGILAVNVGTSAAARMIIHEPWVDPESRLWTYTVDEGLWAFGGIVSSGGIVWDWFISSFGLKGNASSDLHYEFEEQATSIPAGAEGLIFLPYLGGEQSPNWRSNLRGGFWGLEFKHQRPHLARAVMEGITRSIYRVAETINTVSSQPIREIRVTGGLTASPLWLQIAADMFNHPVLVPDTTEGSARGAAMLASLSLGWHSTYDDFSELFTSEKRAYPREEIHAIYEKQYQTFLKLVGLSDEH